METLLEKGIVLPSGEINRTKINLVSGAVTQPFAEMIWATVLYALLGLQFSEEAIPMGSDSDVLDYFLFSFLADLGEILKDYRI